MPKQLIQKTYTIASSGGAVTFDVLELVDVYSLMPTGNTTVVLGTPLTIDPTGTPKNGMQFVFAYGGKVVYDGATVTVFGRVLSPAEALKKYIITCTYTADEWVVEMEFGDLGTMSGAFLTDGTVNGGSKLIQYSIILDRLVNATARGYFMRAGVSGVWEAISGGTAGNFLQYNGTDIVSQAITGDILFDASGVGTIQNNTVTTATILNDNVTVEKVSDSLKTSPIPVDVSFDAGELGAYTIKMPYAGSFSNAYAVATKAISNTDAGTVIFKNNAGTTMTCDTPISFGASDARGTAYDTNITANNTFVAGDIITIFTAKTTAGGKVLVTLTAIKS